jgi:hypothetical protein
VSYIGLGSRYTVAAKDQTGLNAGNLTNAFTDSIVGIKIAQFEVYHMVVTNVPGNAMASIYIGARQWGFTNPLSGSEWDPSQPMLLNPGQELDFLWDLAATGTVLPQVTAWYRYDPTLPGNR